MALTAPLLATVAVALAMARLTAHGRPARRLQAASRDVAGSATRHRAPTPALPRRWPGAWRGRHVDRIARHVPDVLELLTILLRAGLTTRQAIEFLAVHGPLPTRPAFADALGRIERGTAPADALAALPRHVGRDAQVAVDVIGHADRYGLALVPALEQLATEARNARQRRAEADARRLPVRLSFPLVTCTLPSFVLLAIAPAVLAALASLGDTQW